MGEIQSHVDNLLADTQFGRFTAGIGRFVANRLQLDAVEHIL
jgi:hypothetical protein